MSRAEWQVRDQIADSPPRSSETRAFRKESKFACPECGQNAWGKPDTQLICGACYEDGEGEICLMLAALSDEAA